MIDTADTTARIPIARAAPALFLSSLCSPLSLSTPARVSQSGTQNGEFSLPSPTVPVPSIRSRSTSLPPFLSLSPSLGAQQQAAAPPRKMKRPLHQPAEFSPVTIGSLGRGTSSGLHDAVPSHPPADPMAVPLSSSIPRAIPPFLIPVHHLHPLFSPTLRPPAAGVDRRRLVPRSSNFALSSPRETPAPVGTRIARKFNPTGGWLTGFQNIKSRATLHGLTFLHAKEILRLTRVCTRAPSWSRFFSRVFDFHR